MKKIILFLIVIFLFSFLSSYQINSSTYNLDLVVSNGGENISSENYRTDIVLGEITGNTSSTLYNAFVGFFNFAFAEGEVETPTTPPTTTTPSGGGGGGSGTTSIADFSLDRNLIKVLVKQGESKREILKFKNLGSQIFDVEIEFEELEKFIVLSEDSFILESRESKEIFLDIFSGEKEIPGVYTGNIIVEDKDRQLKKIINVIIEVQEKKPLFDVFVDVAYKKVLPGETIKADIDLINMGDLEGFDVVLYTAVKDFNDQVITFREESIAINKKLSLSRKLDLPEEVPYGDYVFYAKVSYEEITAFGSDSFQVVESRFDITVLLMVIIILLLLIITYLLFKRHRRRKRQGF